MLLRMRRFLACGLLMALAALGEVQYDVVARATVDERLRQNPADNKDRRLALETMFQSAGCEGDRLTSLPVGKEPPNVICTLAGETERTIVVGAHFDHVKEGDGIVDNWSGASLLPTLFQSLASAPRKHTFVFIGFTAEEKGLLGSFQYVRKQSKEALRRIRAMINLDTLGLGSTKADLQSADRELADWLAGLTHLLKTPLEWVNFGRVGSSDHVPFRAKKIPVINIHSVTQETLPILHTKRDNLSAIQFDAYYDTYRLMAAYLAVLDDRLPARAK